MKVYVFCLKFFQFIQDLPKNLSFIGPPGLKYKSSVLALVGINEDQTNPHQENLSQFTNYLLKFHIKTWFSECTFPQRCAPVSGQNRNWNISFLDSEIFWTLHIASHACRNCSVWRQGRAGEREWRPVSWSWLGWLTCHFRRGLTAYLSILGERRNLIQY